MAIIGYFLGDFSGYTGMFCCDLLFVGVFYMINIFVVLQVLLLLQLHAIFM